MHHASIATLLTLLFSIGCLASGPSRANADVPREATGEQTPGKPHQPTSIHAPRQQ